MTQAPVAPPAAAGKGIRRLVVLLGVALAILHQDWWFKNDHTIVLGFIPISLFYHICFSIAVAGLWALMSKFAWPTHIEEFAALGDSPPAAAGAAAPSTPGSSGAPAGAEHPQP